MILIKWMLKKKLTKIELAKKLDVSASAIYKYLEFERTPTLEIAVRIVKLTDNEVFFTDLISSKDRKRQYLKATGKAQPSEIIDENDPF